MTPKTKMNTPRIALLITERGIPDIMIDTTTLGAERAGLRLYKRLQPLLDAVALEAKLPSRVARVRRVP